MVKRVLALGGDGIGPEVIDATVYILEGMGISSLEIVREFVGEEAIKEDKPAFSEEVREQIDGSDAVIFGATGGTASPCLHYLRWGLDNFANVRPVKYYEGVRTPLKDPEGIDFVFVRENLEGMYACMGREGKIEDLLNVGLISEGEFDKYGRNAFYGARVISERGSERVGRFACELAMKRKRCGGKGKLTIIHKANVLKLQDGLFRDTIYRVVEEEFSELEVDDYYVDNMARMLIRYPKEFDVVVIPNMMGDILTDLSAELVGGLGISSSGLFGGRVPYFEPIHGSAPKYAGSGVANPIATILSSVMMLEYLGFEKEAECLDDAVASLILGATDPEENWRFLPRDLVSEQVRIECGYAETMQVAEEILKECK
ncbi:MAG: isocitrate/isopropylmalate family dehydrogenase [Halobacteriota archaeon]|nr:isocitrate/isopropylmalate family dehydrogenase [Halobacteriota archaeon]